MDYSDLTQFLENMACLINSFHPVWPIQMVMLSSLTDLLRFIDENQLSTEFGGTLEQSHSDWIVLRTVSNMLCAGAAHWQWNDKEIKFHYMLYKIALNNKCNY